jgi:hypothetical protein
MKNAHFLRMKSAIIEQVRIQLGQESGWSCSKKLRRGVTRVGLLGEPAAAAIGQW